MSIINLVRILIVFRDIQKSAPEVTVIVYDNSTKDYGNAEFCKKNNFVYFTQHANNGISKAYDYVIDHVSFDKDDF